MEPFPADSRRPSSLSDGAQQGTTPAITLPKGGGAIRGIGEKFAANPVTGTGSMSVPLATSPGRAGFGPQLSLSYDSGAGNGPFGFGWSLSLPSITRKTDKGLPQYFDAQDSDVFVLSGAEDLVPLLVQDAQGEWSREVSRLRTVGGVSYSIDRYRPRIEGLFARLERWSNLADETDVFWRSISRDNITTWYGQTAESRIADPADSRRIFSWLICQSHDDKGNVIVYDYKAEDSSRVFEDSAGILLSKAHEQNRSDQSRSAQRYLKRARYGHHAPYFPELKADAPWPMPLDDRAPDGSTAWHFEAVFDYGEHDIDAPTPDDSGTWPARPDPFSSYRAAFEIRTYRSCQRVLMFHHFPGEAGVGQGCLVRSTDFSYSDEVNPTDVRNPVYTFLRSVTQSGYRRANGGYAQSSLPPVEFEYSQSTVQDTVEEIDPESLEHLPIGLDGSAYRWIDLHGEGLPGLLNEQAGAWFYKRNLSPIPDRRPDGREVVQAHFAPLERVALKPNVALSAGAEFMDLAGDGQPDVVVMDGPMPGLYEHDQAEGWQPFRPFKARLSRDLRDPIVKFIDLDGDGHADVLITEDDAFVWHASLGEAGFEPSRRVALALNEEQGPRIVFADGTQSIYLADFSGDGLTDIVRIRNGAVCYWPNLGYGRFGAKVTMDNAPRFDVPDVFDHGRLRLADIDGSGTTDIVYLHKDGVRLYFNQSGNSWGQPQTLKVFPRVDDVVSIVPIDLLGNGTACLVWSSPLAHDARRPMRYVNLMGGRKPHLLVKTTNNLGAETRVEYAPSTKFYLLDKRAGTPWITRLPFPVHVVERVETIDHISRNRFVSRSAYHHGYFDGEEREFRGFGMVEQWDTEQFAALTGGHLPADNITATSHVPPVHTKTWFHTGVSLGQNRVSLHFENEYYREPGLTVVTARPLLLDDSILPAGLTVDAEREACRALKGSMLRQEVYADDAMYPGASLEQIHRARTPYTVTEQNFVIRPLQPRGPNRHAVLFTHAGEALSYHYERNSADPRLQHALTLEVDDLGNVLKQAAIGYGRRTQIRAVDGLGNLQLVTNPGLAGLQAGDQLKQTTSLLTYTESQVTNAIESPDMHRTPLPCEALTFELTRYPATGPAGRFQASDLVEPDPAAPGRLRHRFAAPEVAYEATAAGNQRRRPIEWLRTLYRRDDLSGLLPFGDVQPLALPGESYKLAFTPGLLTQVFQRPHPGQAAEPLLPDPAAVLGSQAGDGGGYLRSQTLKADGRFPASDADDRWWLPSGQSYFSPNPAHTAAAERAQARQHFFLPRCHRDPFGQDAIVDFDTYDLLMTATRDALGNRVTVDANDYRVLQPHLVSDPNRNRAQVAFNILGQVVGTAVMGKPEETLGDSLDGFRPDLSEAEIQDHLANPLSDPHGILGRASSRLVYDLFAYSRTRDQPAPQPAVAYALTRETHDADLAEGQLSLVQHSFAYSDGFGREIQKKVQAEAGPVAGGDLSVNPRWVGSGWTTFNNKGQPVRQYEPYFSSSHTFEFDVQVGVSPVLFYDPLGRVMATLHPNDSYQKVIFDPWKQISYDVNDTVLDDPRTDPDLQGFTAGYFAGLPPAPPWQTWHAQRAGGARGTLEQAAAGKAAQHAGTPSVVHLDTLGRPFLTLSDNGPDPAHPGQHLHFATRVELDIEGNQRSVTDALNRVVMRYGFDMLGRQVRQDSMEAGSRWALPDIFGNLIRAWDSRGFARRLTFDAARRPLDLYVQAGGAQAETLAERTVYGEGQGDAFNHRGRVYQGFDAAGVISSMEYDFKGNPLRSSRRLTRDFSRAPDWLFSVTLESETFVSSARFDALGRPVQQIVPHSDRAGSTVNVIQSRFNEANLLEAVDVWLGQGAAPTSLLDVSTVDLHAVTNLEYNAKGQRTRIDYGNGATTSYTYDSETFRLTHLETRRGGGIPGDPPGQLQRLSYTHDPAGNIMHIQDDAQQTIFYANQVVTPSTDYRYDAVYRLIEATGREHRAQGVQPQHPTWDDAPRAQLQHPGDGQAMRTYTEQYVYDAVGNFQEMRHSASGGDWTRSYTYAEASLLEPAKQSNRLSSSTVAGITGQFPYDQHGNMTTMPHLPQLTWNFENQLQRVDLGGGGQAYYVYDADGQRVRKVVERTGADNAVTRVNERVYLGGFEVYREQDAGRTFVTLERETLHVTDDQSRIAMIETHTQGTAGSPAQLIRYQLSNHLGSSSLELDELARIISYEEYYPYGSTSYQAVHSQTETAKRYRYSGKERDEESGLYYHGARYYAPWLVRWISTDPIGVADHINLYAFVRLNPVKLTDLTGLGVRDWIYENVLEPTAEFIEAHGVDDAVAGFGDTLSFGLSQKVREKLDINTVDYESTAYKGGSVAGTVWGVAIGGSGAANVVSRYGWKRGAAIVGGFFAGQQGISFGLDKIDPSGWASGVFNTALLVSPLAKGPTSGKIRLWSALTEAEIAGAVEGNPSTGSFVKDIPASALESGKYSSQFETGSYGKGGQQHGLHVDANTSAPGNTGTAKTTVRWHDSDPSAPAGSTSRTQSTMAIEQAKGKRRLVPDANQPSGGRWVQAGKHGNASQADRAAMHIPLHSDGGRLPFFFSGAAAAAGISLLRGATSPSASSGQSVDTGSGALLLQDSAVYVPDEELVSAPIIIGVGGRF